MKAVSKESDKLIECHTYLIAISARCGDNMRQYIQVIFTEMAISCYTTEPVLPYRLQTCNSYTMGCPPVRGDNPRALASGLSYVQVDKHGITRIVFLQKKQMSPPPPLLMSKAWVIKYKQKHKIQFLTEILVISCRQSARI